jgi:hypothetical protein
VKLGLLTLREEHRHRAFENRVLKRMYGWRRDEGIGGWRNRGMKSFMTVLFTNHNYSQVKEDEMSRACRSKGRRGMHIGYWWVSQKERDYY